MKRKPRALQWPATVARNDSSRLSREESQQLARLAQAGDAKARDRLVASCDRLAVQFGHRYARSAPHLLDDLIAEARLAIVESVAPFDPERGMSFGTYARWALRNGCGSALKEQRWAITLPFSRHKGLAERIAHIRTESVNVIDEDGEETEMPLAAPEPDGADHLLAERLAAALPKLSPRDRRILTERYFRGRNLREIGEGLGVSCERIRQIEAEALGRLRRSLVAR